MLNIIGLSFYIRDGSEKERGQQQSIEVNIRGWSGEKVGDLGL